MYEFMDYLEEDASYGWVITKDHLAKKYKDIESEVGTYGPSTITGAIEKALHAGKGHKFKMYDDDGELYYSGRIVIDGEPDYYELVAPLRDFGTPNAGAVRVDYKNHPEWNEEWY